MEAWDWINNNSAGVQAIGSIIAILLALGVVWLQHRLDLSRSDKSRRDEDARQLETVAAIVINAMNLIQAAKEQMCDKDMIQGYYTENHSPSEFTNAANALQEIPIAQLPDFRVVKPVLEMRGLILRVERLVGYIAEGEHNGKYDYLEGVDRLKEIYLQANEHTRTVKETVIRIRDSSK